MALALFDLDNTLLDGDSDSLWGEFLVQGWVAGIAAFRAGKVKRGWSTMSIGPCRASPQHARHQVSA